MRGRTISNAEVSPPHPHSLATPSEMQGGFAPLASPLGERPFAVSLREFFVWQVEASPQETYNRP